TGKPLAVLGKPADTL
ncbi:rCG55326, partial [Rattus norvegicus]